MTSESGRSPAKRLFPGGFDETADYGGIIDAALPCESRYFLPEQQADCRAMGHVIQFVDIRVGRSPVRVAGLAENRRLEWRGGV